MSMLRDAVRRRLRRPTGAVAHPAVVLLVTGLELLLWGGDGRVRVPGVAPQPWAVLVVEAVLVTVLLTQGRTLARTYLLVWGLTVALAALFPRIEPFGGLLLVLYRVVRTSPRSQAALLALATVVPWTLDTVNAVTSAHLGPTGALVDALLWCVMTVLVWAAARYALGLEQLALAREAAAHHRGRLALHEERLRLARELHDVVSHSVSAVILQAAGAQRALAPEPELREVLATIESTSTTAMRELRGLLGLLAPADGAEAAGEGGLEHGAARPGHRLDQLDDLLETTRACGIDVTVRLIGTARPLDPLREEVAYSVVREGLTNVIRHGGSGSCVRTLLRWESDRLEVEIVSTAPDVVRSPVGGRSGRGLDGLRGRLAEVGGDLAAEPQRDGSFRVLARVPLSS